ncbi:Mut7-C RNAse domain-containing protein [Marinobacter sp.]|uniref:Mut7-C RNAse domain-containing protein n=1 Tax=Marinobacter sp. TaxID=50741 RepID=UPI00384E9932
MPPEHAAGHNLMPATVETGALCPLDTPRFLCDEMLQGLGEWLRVAGYDTRLPETGTEDRDVLAMAVAENRWLVTRDRALALHRDGPLYVLLLESGGQDACIRELTGKLNLDWLHAPFSRCKRCNTPFREGPLPGSSASPESSPQTLLHCTQCHQTFWKGSHVRRMREKLREFNRWRRTE